MVESNQRGSRQLKSMNAIEQFWCFLGGPTALLFGRESASAMVWMLLALSGRFLVVLLRLGGIVPIGLLFASPYALQVDDEYLLPKIATCLSWLMLDVDGAV